MSKWSTMDFQVSETILSDTDVTICHNPYNILGFPVDSDSKESACNARDLGLTPQSGRYPGKGSDNPLQYSCLGESHGQRSLAGYSPWGCKDLDTTE